MRVIETNTTDNYIDVVMYPDSEVPGGKNYPPEELMAITRRGNTTDEDRQDTGISPLTRNVSVCSMV